MKAGDASGGSDGPALPGILGPRMHAAQAAARARCARKSAESLPGVRAAALAQHRVLNAAALGQPDTTLRSSGFRSQFWKSTMTGGIQRLLYG